MLQTVLMISLMVLSLSLVICMYRIITGPTMPDRIVALDTTGLNVIGFIGLIMIGQETLAYSEVALVIAILAFIGTIALAKYLEGGTIID